MEINMPVNHFLDSWSNTRYVSRVSRQTLVNRDISICRKISEIIKEIRL